MTAEARDDILFACDVGNTRAAFALVMGGRIQEVVRVPLAGLDDLADCFTLDAAERHGRTDAPFVVSSVNPAATERIRSLAADLTSGAVLFARHDFPVPIDTCVDHPDRVGVDRLLGALAAYGAAGGAAVVVGVGTAVTVDAVDAAGRFLGGSILPSPSVGAWSLKQKTAALPEVTLSVGGPAPEAVGRNTEAAIRSGLLLGTAGAVERLVDEQRKSLGGEVRVIATGGGLPLLARSLRCLDETRPNLVLEGLVAAYLVSR